MRRRRITHLERVELIAYLTREQDYILTRLSDVQAEVGRCQLVYTNNARMLESLKDEESELRWVGKGDRI